jgi:hypothetical protein
LNVPERYRIGLGAVGSYPYGVEFWPENPGEPIYFWEGSGHMSAGGMFTAQQALESQWRDHLETAGAIWFVPFIERLAAGERLDMLEVEQAYHRLHGSDAVIPKGS